MARLAFALLALCAVATARMAYVLPDGARFLLKARNFLENFSCSNRSYGYYADVDNNCQIFHICLPMNDNSGKIVDTAQFSFVCGNDTIFSQDSLTCVYENEALPCEEATNLYDISNSLFGKIHSNFSVPIPSNANRLGGNRGTGFVNNRFSTGSSGISGSSTSDNSGLSGSTASDNSGLSGSTASDSSGLGVSTDGSSGLSSSADGNSGFSDANSGLPNQDAGSTSDASSGLSGDTTNVLGNSNDNGGFSGFSNTKEDASFSK